LRALVTGGTGFIGANIVAALNEAGIETRVLMRPSSSSRALAGLQYKAQTGDILNNEKDLSGSMTGCDWVFHTAAVSDYWRQDTKAVYRVNVEGTHRVLEAAKTAGVKRLIYTSSISALGWPQKGHLLDEASLFNLDPSTWPYAHSKHLAEKLVVQAAEDGFPAVIVNLPIVLGPRDVNMISGSIIVEAHRGLARFYPPGGTNFASAEDVAVGHLRAAERGRPGERYILAGWNLSYKESFTRVCQVVGRPAPRLALPQWVLPPFAASVKLARAVLGNRIPFNSSQVKLSGVELYVDGKKAFDELQLPLSSFEETVQNAYDWYNINGYLN
jgi:dihydroflavonol-4-reductase